MWWIFGAYLSLYEWFDYFRQGHLEGESEGFIKGWKIFIKFEKIFFKFIQNRHKICFVGQVCQTDKAMCSFTIRLMKSQSLINAQYCRWASMLNRSLLKIIPIYLKILNKYVIFRLYQHEDSL